MPDPSAEGDSRHHSDPQPISVTGSTDPGQLTEEPSSVTELFLIAHKVRSEPAFDIAQRSQIGDEEGWIIPTSGHRAYPYWWILLENIDDRHELRLDRTQQDCDAQWALEGPPPMPTDLPDHYACNDRPLATQIKINLQALGLVRPKPKIERRL
jgi:hypothetical protein